MFLNTVVRALRIVVIIAFMTLFGSCASVLYDEAESPEYKTGYIDGFKASHFSLELILDSISGTPHINSGVPENILVKNREKTLDYQRGYISGWKKGIEGNIVLYDRVFSSVFSSDCED